MNFFKYSCLFLSKEDYKFVLQIKYVVNKEIDIKSLRRYDIMLFIKIINNKKEN